MSTVETALGGREIEVVAKATRRRFTLEYKWKIVRETDRCKTPGRSGRCCAAARNRRAGRPLSRGAARAEKDAAVRAFEGPIRILLSTEAGGEGRNLQFAHELVNYDLPWKPNAHRAADRAIVPVGQTRDVHVFNLVAAGTLEEMLLEVLDAKINMFELVIGEIDMILGQLTTDEDFEELVTGLWLASEDVSAFRAAMQTLGDRLLAASSPTSRPRRSMTGCSATRSPPEPGREGAGRDRGVHCRSDRARGRRRGAQPRRAPHGPLAGTAVWRGDLASARVRPGAARRAPDPELVSFASPTLERLLRDTTALGRVARSFLDTVVTPSRSIVDQCAGPIAFSRAPGRREAGAPGGFRPACSSSARGTSRMRGRRTCAFYLLRPPHQR
jgi:Helicase conserved C-terminal domain